MILGIVAVAVLAVAGLFFFAVDYYIPSNAIEAAVQTSDAGQVEDRLYELLRGCHSRRRGARRSYTRGSIGHYNRSFPSIRNDKGWLGGTHIQCGPTGCTATATAMISSPRKSASCRTWQPVTGRDS